MHTLEEAAVARGTRTLSLELAPMPQRVDVGIAPPMPQPVGLRPAVRCASTPLVLDRPAKGALALGLSTGVSPVKAVIGCGLQATELRLRINAFAEVVALGEPHTGQVGPVGRVRVLPGTPRAMLRPLTYRPVPAGMLGGADKWWFEKERAEGWELEALFPPIPVSHLERYRFDAFRNRLLATPKPGATRGPMLWAQVGVFRDPRTDGWILIER